jgi:BirA family biotin operon repressor/biotin-[acetyl-CoA-carboxylase] ligase
LLADGRFQSGTALGRHLGITRAAVNKAVKALSDAGVEIHRVSGKGYRLALPVSPLVQEEILAHLGSHAEHFRNRILVVDELESTSDHLNRHMERDALHRAVCLAESQTRGRGRRGRGWFATPYQNLMLSVGWQFERGPGALTGLSLAAGVAVLRALEGMGVTKLGLKWPNDVMWDGRKLGGLLIDVQGEVAGPSRVVLGLGLNVRQGPRAADAIDQPWAQLDDITDEPVNRNRLAGQLLAGIFDALVQFEREGFDPFREAWQQAHIFHGRPVRILQHDCERRGTVVGIDNTGALQIRGETDEIETFHSGEISLRSA